MIHTTLKFLEHYINTELKEHPGDAPVVKTAGIIKEENPASEDKIFLSLVHIEEERFLKNQDSYKRNDDRYSVVNPEIRLNLYLLVSAQYRSTNYTEALKQLSRVIGVFQARGAFGKEDFAKAAVAGIDVNGLETLIAELYPLTLEQGNSMWQALGSDMVPAVLYKIRVVTIQKGEELRTEEEIKEIHIRLKH